MADKRGKEGALLGKGSRRIGTVVHWFAWRAGGPEFHFKGEKNLSCFWSGMTVPELFSSAWTFVPLCSPRFVFHKQGWNCSRLRTGVGPSINSPSNGHYNGLKCRWHAKNVCGSVYFPELNIYRAHCVPAAVKGGFVLPPSQVSGIQAGRVNTCSESPTEKPVCPGRREGNLSEASQQDSGSLGSVQRRAVLCSRSKPTAVADFSPS